MSGLSFGPIDIFRTGTFSPMEGRQAKISRKDLQQIADNYDPAEHPAPVVIGHPRIDAPAYGWVDKLYVEGDKLKATVTDVVAEFADLVKKGRYKKVSISMFLPGGSAKGRSLRTTCDGRGRGLARWWPSNRAVGPMARRDGERSPDSNAPPR